jgi:hypothetical protein
MSVDLLPIVLVALYFLSVFGWIRLFYRRLEPRIRARIGRILGVEIVWRIEGFRRGGWSAMGGSSTGTGCLIAFWEMVVVYAMGALPIFFLLLVLGLFMFAIYD